MNERVRLSLLCLLLVLMLGILAFTTVSTLQAARTFQQQYSAAKAGDVNTIHPWMTIHVISRIYHVPENYLYSSLNLNTSTILHHATLYDLAQRKRQPVDQVIRTLRGAILKYRREHHHAAVPTPPPPPRTHHTLRHPPPTPGRTHA